MSDLKKISTLAEQFTNLLSRIEKGEALLKDLKEQARLVSEEMIPAAMDEVGMEEFTLSSGDTISVENIVTATISEPNRATAFAWLRKHKHGSIIKREIKLNFGMGEDKQAKALLALLKKSKLRPTSDKETVHPSTLKAFVKEQLAEGKDIPMDVFGVYEVRRASVVRAS